MLIDVPEITAQEFEMMQQKRYRELCRKHRNTWRTISGPAPKLVMKDGKMIGTATDAAAINHCSSQAIRSWCIQRINGWKYA